MPEPLAFFLDRSIGRLKVAEALRQAGARVEIHDDYFPPDAEDQDWLSEVGRRGWIILTRDQKIRHRKLELAALWRSRVGAFVFTGGNVSGEEMAATLASVLPALTQFVLRHPRPFIATITKSGSIQLVKGGGKERQ